MKKLVDLPVEAGIYTEQTARGAVGRWKDGDKIRFRYGLPEKIGGWDRVENLFIGLVRKLWDWSSLDGRTWVSMGTESKLYLWQGGILYDITPLRRSIVLTDPFDTVMSSDIVTVNDPAHGAQDGDYVNFIGASAVGGLTVDGEYRLTLVDSNSYTIVDDETASSTVNGGGGTVTAEYDISVGASTTVFGTGWGTGTWSQSTWNTPRTVSQTVTALRTWSLDNWGEDLISNPRGGALYWWDRNTGANTRAVILPAAPPNSNYMIISQRDRHLFALGCTDEFTGLFDPLLIRWCSKEDFSDWTPTSVNTAGDLRIYRGSKIEAAIRTRGEILVFTDVSVHQINFLGGTSVYGLTVAGENVSILGPNAAVEVDYRVFFMAESDFYLYDGVLQVLPSDVRNEVYDNINIFQKDKCFAGLNRQFNEIWFFYPGKERDVWTEADFTSGLLENFYQQQTETFASVYTVAFTAPGFINLTLSPSASSLDALYFLRTGAKVADPLNADYEVKFEVNDASHAANYGLASEITDLTGAGGTSADNANFIECVILPSTSTMRVRHRVVGAITAFTNAAGSYDLTALPTPITITTGETYAILMTRSHDAETSISTLTFYLWDETNDITQTVGTFDLTAPELALFPGTVKKCGVNLQAAGTATLVDSMRVTSHRVAPAGVLVAQTQRGVATEVNRYALYNYTEKTWAIGTMVRTAWHDRSPVFNLPYAGGDDSFLYQHEIGTDDNGAALPSFLETYDMEIPESGENLMHVDKLVPDFLELDGTVNILLKGKKYPQVTDYQEKGPYPITSTTRKVSTRIRGRQIAMRVETSAIGDRWRMGTMRARIAPHGKRA